MYLTFISLLWMQFFNMSCIPKSFLYIICLFIYLVCSRTAFYSMRVEQMERQLASLTGLVHKALSSATSPRPDHPTNQQPAQSIAQSPSPRLTANQITGNLSQASSPRLISNQQLVNSIGPSTSPRLAPNQQAVNIQDNSLVASQLAGIKATDFLQVPVKSSSGKKLFPFSLTRFFLMLLFASKLEPFKYKL